MYQDHPRTRVPKEEVAGGVRKGQEQSFGRNHPPVPSKVPYTNRDGLS